MSRTGSTPGICSALADRTLPGDPQEVAALSKGGHLRVGMEDVLTISRGVPVESNAQLVERAVEAGQLAQRTPMTPAEARDLLGMA